MDKEYLNKLTELGYADEAGLAADVSWSENIGKRSALCVNGEVVTLVCGDPPEKAFKDSIDRLKNLAVSSGLFTKKLSFEHNGKNYLFTIKKKNKNLLEYFELIVSE